MLKKETGLPATDDRSMLRSPNLGSSRSTQPKASGRTGTKIDNHARISTTFRPGISVRAINHTSTSAMGSEMAVRVTDSAKLFHRALMAEGSVNAACQLPNPYLKDWPDGATLKLLIRSMPSGSTRMMPTIRGKTRETARLE